MGRIIETEYILRIKTNDTFWCSILANKKQEKTMQQIMSSKRKELAISKNIKEEDIEIIKHQYLTGGKSIQKVTS